MKILYLSKAIIPSEISNSLSIMRMCQAFADFGNEVLLTSIASSDSDSDPINYYGVRGGFKIVSNALSRGWNNRFMQKLLLSGFILAWKTRHLLREFRPDIIYSRLTITEIFFVPKRIPIIYEMHSLGPLGKSFLQNIVFRLLVKRKNFRRIIVTTNVLADMLKKRLPGVEIVVARLSAEIPVSVSADGIETFREKQLRGGSFKHHVGYTGCLDRTGLRGTDIICQVAAQMPKVAFHIVGGAPEIVEYWKDRANDYNQAGNIFFYGYRNPDQMPFFLACFDVVLAPLQFQYSKRAPFGLGMSPLKIPQYMSYAKAIVASDLISHREILKNMKTAMLVPGSDVSEWIKVIKRILDDDALRSKIEGNAHAHYFSEFTPEMRVNKILSRI